MNKRTLLAGLAASLMTFGLIFTPAMKAEAAQTLAANQTVTDTFTNDSEKNYTYTVAEKGYFTVSVDVSTNQYLEWCLYITDKEGNKIYENECFQKSFESYKLPIKSGSELNVRLWNYSGNENQSFKITINSTAASNWEQEANDSFATTNTVKPGQKYYGNLTKNNDQDFFSYTVQKDGKQTISFAPVTDFGYYGNYDITIYDAKTKDALFEGSLHNRYNFPVMNFTAGTKLIIGLVPNDLTLGTEYSFQITETSTTNWEHENRVTEDAGWKAFSRSATMASVNEKYNGFLWESNDTDLYKVTVSKPGNFEFIFEPTNMSGYNGAGYSVSILNSKGNEIAVYDNLIKRTAKTMYLNADSYYVKINATLRDKECTNRVYGITVKYTKYTPAKVASVAAKADKISWKSQTKATGYEVQYSLKSNFSNAKKKTVTKNSATISLQKKKTYYVRVRAYKLTATKQKVYGPWSKTVKTIKK